MNRFWKLVMEPILSQSQIHNIVEIGSQRGLNTLNILDFCKKAGAVLHCIDPFPVFDYGKLQDEFKDQFLFYKELSLSVLPLLKNIDAVLIDGDHNWYTVFHELKSIEANAKENGKFPIIFLHDIGWPYGRRDLYYNPENIPLAYQQPHKQMGLSLETSSLVENGMNGHLHHAIYENNTQNGVLTAIEDFINQSYFDLEFFQYPGLFGLGILVSKEKNAVLQIQQNDFHKVILPIVEKERILQKIRLDEHQAKSKAVANKLKDAQQMIENLRDELSKCKQDNITKQMEIEKLIVSQKVEIEKLCNSQKVEIEKIISSHEVEIDNFRSKISALTEKHNNELLQIKKSLQVENDRTKDFEAKLQVLQKENQDLHKKINNVTKDKKDAEIAAGVHLNSVRYRLGDAFVKAIKPSRNTIALPIRIVRLLKEGLRKERVNIAKNNLSSLNEVPVKKNDNSIKKEQVVSNVFKKDTKGSFPQSVDIVIPIYNAYDELKECVASILDRTEFPYRLILIDDCSPDSRIEEYLSSLMNNPKITVVKNVNNLGFIGTVNKGLQYSDKDVVILNSDTRVTKEWLRSLVVCAYSKPEIGTVTPVSNAAGPFSVPHFNQNNDLPEGYTENQIAKLIAQSTRYHYPEVPTGNGYCMYIKRYAINLVGTLDPIFGRGYCEENDFCMRLRKAGMVNVIDDSTFVYHKRSASFGEDKLELIKKNRKILDERYPEYKLLVSEFLNRNPLEYLQIELRLEINKERTEKLKLDKENMLFVLHKGGGGTPLTNLDLTRQLSEEYNCFILTSDRHQLELSLVDYDTKGLIPIRKYSLLSPIELKEFTRFDYKHILKNILRKLNIKLVHIRHLLGHTFDLPYLAKEMNIPLVFSFHDFYFICPSIQLLDDQKKYCGGHCTASNGVCNYPKNWFTDMPDLKNKWIYVWRENVLKMLKQVEHFVTTSEYTKNKFCEIYSDLKHKDFRVIPHGRDLDLSQDLSNPPQPNEKIKLITFGGINESKGKDLFLELMKIDKERENRLEVHVLGNAVRALQEQAIYHGPYDREELGQRLASIRPHFTAIFSIWPETFCHTLTETWAYKLPPFVSDIGTLKDRVEESGGGWLVDFNDAEKVYNQILLISDHPDEYQNVVNKLKQMKFKDTNAMANEYKLLYRELSPYGGK